MKIVKTRIFDGRAEVTPEIVDDSQVAILASDEGETVTLSPRDEAELSAALEAIRTGQYTDGWALLDALKAKRKQETTVDPKPGEGIFERITLYK